ncbi:putative Xre family transcriptional regulator [Selenomonas ruminantium subsp. lactilytica TAM6421]|uniref:Putative Xre family transcriptional regulator n=1 Tax=Selenomonas ruminantium subsp. lactilytica (strain NBRC 103574 / TAM6421) TaxID=927704 RepID=I0GS25_SELRL|nr:helix-turn-helix transcriptional regulator [Selenomonas ruminantium]BAL83562.1 putative Xre family transcriptional regulator [Selenomonas ruminantium subsp. lactilytica TAM6421]
MCRIKELRKRYGMTQEEMLAKFNSRFNMNYTASALSLIENEKRIPDALTMCKFADFFGVSLDYLMSRSDIEKPAKTLHDGSNGLWTVSLDKDHHIYEIVKWYHSMPKERQLALYHYAQYLFGKDTLLQEIEESRKLKKQLIELSREFLKNGESTKAKTISTGFTTTAIALSALLFS